MRVKVLLEPVMADRAYMAGEELELSEADAEMLERWGIVEPIHKATPKAKHGKAKAEAETETESETEA
jgi:hypothetical protein